MDLGRIQQLRDSVRVAAEAHKACYGDRVWLLEADVKRVYAQEVDSVLAFLVGDSRIVPITTPSHRVLKSFFLAECHAGDELYHFGPPLSISPGEDFPIAMIVYTAMRMSEEGIVGLKPEKDARQDGFFNYLMDNFNEREASALNSMLSIAIVNSAIHRLTEKGFRESADAMLRLSSQVSSGVMAENVPSTSLTFDLYKRIIERSAIAREMLLNQVFMRSLPWHIRSKLFSLTARVFEVRKIVEDLSCRSLPRLPGSVDLLKVPGISRRTLQDYVGTSLEKLWADACLLPSEVRDVMALRIFGCLEATIKEVEIWSSNR